MHVSLSEFEATLVKAALVVGLPLGPAEQAGMAARLALARGFDPLSSCVLALESLDAGRSGGFDLGAAVKGSFQPNDACLSALAAGPSALDLLAAGNTGAGAISLRALDAPGVFVSLALLASEQSDSGIVLTWPEGKAEAVFRNGTLSLAKGRPGDLAAPGPLDLILDRLTLDRVEGEGRATARTGRTSSAKAAVLRDGAEVDGALWHCLAALADRRLVAGTEASRLAGAGAGVVDTD